MRLPAPAQRLLRQQHGLITRSQLLRLGVPPGTVGTWQTRGDLETVDSGVYRLPEVPRSRRQSVLAAVLRCGSGARAGGWTACWLHGLEGFTAGAQHWVLIPAERRVRAGGIILQRSTASRRELATIDGIPTLGAGRALIDTALRIRGHRLRIAIDDARRRDLLTLDGLLTMAEGLVRHRGAARIRRMFGSGILDQDGEAERWLATGLAAHGVFPLWSVEVLPGVFPDATLPEAQLVVECDGGEHHTLEIDRAADVMRASLLRHEGWDVLRVTGTELRRDRRGAVARVMERRIQRMQAGYGVPGDWRPLGRRLRR